MSSSIRYHDLLNESAVEKRGRVTHVQMNTVIQDTCLLCFEITLHSLYLKMQQEKWTWTTRDSNNTRVFVSCRDMHSQSKFLFMWRRGRKEKEKGGNYNETRGQTRYMFSLTLRLSLCRKFLFSWMNPPDSDWVSSYFQGKDFKGRERIFRESIGSFHSDNEW